MDLWRHAHSAADAPYTTITTWHNTGKDVDYQGERYYWTKDREFERFLDLPRRRPALPFELAVGVDEAPGSVSTATAGGSGGRSTCRPA